ncbi:hypothetical protein C1645_820944 [Glomus cerebriforme]|uniref:BTB/POZ domain-containing protein n=1 Tax=Glomus cerebriforme TaxID=658196 RepID=A0A397T1R1_9GLOM|nr:hypothetical protein C1645_820944 [Glomus cerebriforme]
MLQKLFLPVLSNFENLYKSKKNYDVIIQTGEENNQKEIYAHSVVLCCQSNYFDAAFSTNWAEKVDGKYILRKPNISSYILETIIRYLYCGQLELSIENGSDILKLLIAADEFGINTLSEFIQEFLIDNLKEFLENNPNEILEIIFQHEALTTLKDDFLETICQDPDVLFGTDKFLTLPEQILELLLKRDDLSLDEIDIWDNLIAWGHAHQPTVNKDPSVWTKFELTLMENTLSKFISLIRFYGMPSEEFYDGVMPYEDLLPKKLRNEILKSYLAPRKLIGSFILPSRTTLNKIDSIFINVKHLALFAGWIDKKDGALKKIPYIFNLILRGSNDGFSSADFHAKCNNKGATIIIAKIKKTNRLIGGYNPLDWSGSCEKSTPDSFIFSFEDYNDVSTGEIGRVITKSHAIRCFNDFGPIFGSYNRGSNDIMVSKDGKWSSVPNSYPDLNIPRNFEIDDYEVIQVVRKN